MSEENLKTQKIIEFAKNFLGDRANLYQPLFFKLSFALSNEKELEIFNFFLAEVFKKGYLKSASDHKEALKQHGLVTDIEIPD